MRHRSSSTRLLGLAPALVLLLASGPSGAVLIDSGDGTANTTSPSADPGWSHVGRRQTLSAVYLGNGWVLTANHAGFGDFQLGGANYPAVAGSGVQLDDGGTPADLLVFRIDPAPALPILEISANANITGDDVILIGNGRDRGAAHTACSPPKSGYLLEATRRMRWGTNEVAGYGDAGGTAALFTIFDAGGSAHEGHAVNGDSGGAVFVENPSGWELAGVMFGVAEFHCLGINTMAAYGDYTVAADLAVYRAQIVSIVRPECSDEVDNDRDGLVDGDDPDCLSAVDDSERAAGIPALPGLAWWGAATGLFWAARRRALSARS